MILESSLVLQDVYPTRGHLQALHIDDLRAGHIRLLADGASVFLAMGLVGGNAQGLVVFRVCHLFLLASFHLDIDGREVNHLKAFTVFVFSSAKIISCHLQDVHNVFMSIHRQLRHPLHLVGKIVFEIIKEWRESLEMLRTHLRKDVDLIITEVKQFLGVESIYQVVQRSGQKFRHCELYLSS